MNEPTSQEYRDLIFFIKELERLKDNTRTAWTKSGRRESIAEHSWRLSMFALALEDYFPDIDFGKVLRLCLIHDLGEAYEGDVSATIAEDHDLKLKREEQAMQQLSAPLRESNRDKLLELWWEYNKGETQEAKLVKALDKMETIIQHNQGDNPADFDYGFNLTYGREYAQFHPIIKLMREMIDSETEERRNQGKPS